MACGDFDVYREFWIEGQFLDAVICPFTDTMGMPIFALLLLGGVGLVLAVWSGSMVLPIVVFLFVGGAVIASLPSVGLQVAGIVVLLGTAIGLWLLIQRAGSNP